MQAKTTKEFAGRPDDANQTKQFKLGDMVHGELAAVAVREGWAKQVGGAAGAKADPDPVETPKSGKKSKAVSDTPDSGDDD